jgi:hypothetical protein
MSHPDRRLSIVAGATHAQLVVALRPLDPRLTELWLLDELETSATRIAAGPSAPATMSV